ncbi:MAG: hypothetical protein JNL33_02400 [Betaproteobacteria bacterium]|nr:hypothetical protein [Betaproteobacteria bacterium]
MRATMVLTLVAGSVIGFLTGGIAGWALAWDLLGENARLWAVFGGGGAVSGGLVATHLHARIAPAIGRRFARVLGLAVAMPMLIAAAFITRYLFVYAAGSVPWWPIALCLLVHVLVVTLSSVIVMDVVALLLRSIRSFRHPLPPAWGRLAGGEIAGSIIVLAFLGYMPEDGYRSLWFMLQAPRAWPWYEARRSLFLDVLDGNACEVLVVPAEARQRSADRTARDAISAMLGARIADATGLCVNDHELVRRALGEDKRQFDERDVESVATAAGARWIVRSNVALTRDGGALSLSLSASKKDSGRWMPAGNVTLKQLPWSDLDPPEVVVWRELPAAVNRLGLPVLERPVIQRVPAERSFPAGPDELAADTASALDRAERLQLLASFVPRSEPEAATFWLRSLIALRNEDGDDAAVRALSARAWLHLGRRHWAEARTEGRDDRQTRIVRALARGDLVGAREQSWDGRETRADLVDGIAILHLEDAYEHEADARHHRTALLSGHSAYAAYLSHLLENDWTQHPLALEKIRAELERLGAGDDLERTRSFALGVVSRVRWFQLLDRLPPTAGGVIERTYESAWRRNAESWRRRPVDVVSRRDLVEVLFSVNRGLAVRRLEMLNDGSPRPGAALSYAGRIEAALRTHPLIALESMRSARDLGDPAPGMLDTFVRYGALKVAERLVPLEDAWSVFGLRGARLHGLPLPWQDEPIPAQQLVARVRSTGNDPAARHAASQAYARAAAMSQTDITFLEKAVQSGAADPVAGYEQVLAMAGDRYRGSPRRRDVEAWVVGAWDDAPRELEWFAQRISEGAGDWSTWSRAAHRMIRLRRPHDARRLLERWPGFSMPDADPAAAAQSAYEAALMFANAGELALARQFSERSAGMDAGDWYRLESERLLGVLDNDWDRASAAQEAKASGTAYADSVAFATFYDLLKGNADVEDRILDAAQRGRNGWAPRLEVARSRLEGIDAPQAIGRVRAWRIPGIHPETEAWMRAWMATESLLVDRKPAPALLEEIRAVCGSTALTEYAIARGHAALREGRHDEAVHALRGIYPLSVSMDVMSEVRGAALPPLVYSLARLGRIEEARRLAHARLRLGRNDAYYQMAQAVIDGAEGRTAQALDRWWAAYTDLPRPMDAGIPPGYMLLELLEEMHDWRKDGRYAELAADIAVRMAHVWPFGWVHAFVARHAAERSLRVGAAAKALYLDRHSFRLASVPADVLEDARVLLAQRNPLLAPRH